MPLSPAARQHRGNVSELVRLAQKDLSIAFGRITDGPKARDRLMDTLPKLTEAYGSAAASLAADWYDDLRDEAGAPGRFRAIAAELPDRGRFDALARWAVGPLFSSAPDPVAALGMASGGLQRIIFNADRDTITVSSVQDRAARGWQREGDGECDFCQMLIGRGAVYTEASVDFESHDRCRCIGVPAF